MTSASVFLELQFYTIQEIIHVISEKNKSLIKLFKLLVKQIKLNQNKKDQKLIQVCIE